MASQLKVNRTYFDTKFEGYKLDTTDICHHSIEISEGVDIARPNDDQFSFLQQREFSLHNHLHCDPWDENSVYIVNSLRKIYKVSVKNQDESVLEDPFEVWEVGYEQVRERGELNISICFSCEELVVVSDGAGSIYILATGDRKLSSPAWKEVHVERLGEFVKVVDARSWSRTSVHVLCSYVQPKHTYISYLYIAADVDGVWKIQHSSRMAGKGSIDYAALDAQCKSAYVIGQIELKSDLLMEEERNKPPGDPNEISFEWEQSFEDIKIWVKNAESRNFNVSVSALRLDVTAPDGQVILEGSFHRPVEEALTHWHPVKRDGEDYLEVVVTKRDEGSMWTRLFEHSRFDGREIPDPELAGEIHTKLAHLTSETEDVGGATVLNSSQLEECDIADSDGRLLVIHDLTTPTLSTIKTADLGNGQWLMTGARTTGAPPRFCLRFDVDGVVWELNGECVQHFATLCAYGFVQASKSSRVYSFLPRDVSYVGLVDSDGRVFIYRNGVRPLHNDRWGSQQIISLGKTKILGVHPTKSHVFVLSEKHLHLINIPS